MGHDPSASDSAAAAVTAALASQLGACLAMIDQCLAACPDDLWDAAPPRVVGSYPFWMVAYHTLCFVDCYLSPGSAAFAPRTRGENAMPPLHPRGLAELEDEFPSRRFERAELRRYVAICAEKVRGTLASETRASLAGASGFSWLAMPRLEAHLYNLRHASHQAGQLTAFLRRFGVETAWVKAGFNGIERP